MKNNNFLASLKTPWLLPSADKVWMTSLLVLVLTGIIWIYVLFYFYNRQHFPYVNHAVMPVLAWANAGLYACWIGLFLCGLACRAHPRGEQIARRLIYLLVQLYGLGFSVTTYLWGHFTSDQAGAVLLGGVIVGAMLFDRRPVVFAIITSGLTLLGLIVASQIGLIPYAPMFSDSPVSGSVLHGTWAAFGLLVYLIMVVVGWVVFVFLHRLRDRELALSRAGQIISRYVPVQVATAIMSGRDETVNRHVRRRLTLFFSDLVGFTEIAERLDPEDLSRVLNEYFAEMTRIVQRYDGTLDELTGDAILIFFGAPDATTDADHALRAVRMALEMQQTIETLNERWRAAGIAESFRARMGIDTGHATVGNFGSAGRMKYAVLGRHVNLAARLQASCKPGQILLSHSTWLLVQDKIPCEPKGEIELRGIPRPVQTYEVCRPPDLRPVTEREEARQ